MKTAAAYIRVSTNGQLEYSPDSQLKCIRDYASQNGLLLPQRFIFQEDDGISGRGAKKRTEFQHMIGTAKLKPKPFDYVLLWKFSRFARNRTDSVLYKSLLRRLGIEVISVSEPLGDEKTSILVEALIEAMDEYYSINLAEEVKRGMKEKVVRGEPVTAAPFGYRTVDKKYLPDPDTAPFVHMIFREFIGGSGCLDIAEKLNAMGVRTKRGNRWESRSVQYLLCNPVYSGHIRWNPNGHTGRQACGSEPLLCRGIHEPLIDKPLWDEAQKRLNNNKLLYSRSEGPKKETCHMLRGLVFCSSCGSVLVTSSKNSLQCCGYCHGSCRDSHSILRAKLEGMVTSSLETDPSCSCIQISPAVRTGQKEEENLIQAQLRRIDGRLNRLRESYLGGIDSLEEYRRTLSEIMANRQALLSELQSIQKARSKETSVPRFTIADALRGNFFTSEQKNRLLRSFIQKIIFNRNKNRIEIYYRPFTKSSQAAIRRS